MDQQLYFAFTSQLLFQIEYSKISISVIQNNENNCTFVFFAIQSLLGSLANIAKVFSNKSTDPKDVKKILRANDLISYYKLDISQYPQIMAKDLRNTSEHFDERIDKLFEKYPDANFNDCNIGTISKNGESAGFSVPSPNDFFMRHYDDSNKNIMYINNELTSISIINIDALITELTDLEEKINKKAWWANIR